MAFPYVYYSRKDLNATEIQFFDESRASAANKERDTNMPKDYQLSKDFDIKKIVVIPPLNLVSSATAKDTSVDDNVKILLEEACLSIQVGEGEIYYFPVALLLGGANIQGDLEYTLGTAADGSYGFMNVSGNGGLEVNIHVPANTDLKVFITTTSTPSISPVTVALIGEHPE